MSDPLQRLSWDDFRIVKAIGETGGMAAAAQRTGLNHSTVFRRLAQIEAQLKVTIFERRRSGYSPTSAGQEILALAQRLESDIVDVTRRLSGLEEDAAGELRLATSDSLALHLLTPILAEFRNLHPGIRIEIIIGNGPLNLARGETDIVLRATDTPPEYLVGRKMAQIAWAPYVRRADFGSDGPSPDQREALVWATYSDELSGLKAARLLEQSMDPARISYRINSVDGLAAGLAAGMGAGYLPCFAGDIHPELMRLTPPCPEVADDLWLLTHPDLRKSGRVLRFLEFCTIALTRQKPLIEGRSPPI